MIKAGFYFIGKRNISLTNGISIIGSLFQSTEFRLYTYISMDERFKCKIQ